MMRGVLGFVVIWLWAGVAMGQDLTLTSRDGALSVQGTLRAFDGEVYRIDSAYGPLTIEAAAVLCDGPACPDLTAPKAVIRLVGDAEAANALLPPMIAAFAQSKVLTPNIGADGVTRLLQGEAILAEFSFVAMPPDQARAALDSANADLIVARYATGNARVLALDALVPIVSPDNPTPQISTANLARALAGEITNWQQIGGPDRPLVLHGLAEGSDLAAALTARLGKASVVGQTHPDLTSLADAVARDPWALAVTGRALAGAARPLELTDSCGFTLQAASFSVKAQDYPLTLPVLLVTPQRRLPLMAREFLEFLAMPAAQDAITKAGYVARSPETIALDTDGLRLMNAVAGAAANLPDLQRLATAMRGAARLSMTFRFEDDGQTLDAVSKENLSDLAQRLEAGMFDGQVMTLIGFSDGTGDAAQNMALSQTRARAVLASLAALAPDLTQTPAIDAFGEVMPMACDETAAGRRLNRRVEIWLRPLIDR